MFQSFIIQKIYRIAIRRPILGQLQQILRKVVQNLIKRLFHRLLYRFFRCGENWLGNSCSKVKNQLF